jgi:predicted lipoprotein with Yx(FWY)xxD motif
MCILRMYIAIVAAGLAVTSYAAEIASATESYREIPIPAEFHVEFTELDGPVFADANGKTLYKWPLHKLRNGYSGEPPGTPECYDEVVTVTAGLMSPYPPGIKLPEPDKRLSCAELWPPVYASETVEEIGKWSVIERRDGSRQWAFDEQPLYTSIRDRQAGDTIGGSTRRYGGDSPAYRVPIGPPSQLPPGFAVRSTTVGRMLTTDKNESIYEFEGDTSASAACKDSCLTDWRPVVAPALARAQGEWDLLERTPGVLQWVFRGKPLYTHILDTRSWSQQGSDIDGWENVFTQRAPTFPQSFTVQSSIAGDVLADANGRTIYVYRCGEDSSDQLACDHPEDTQVYRLAMCGGGDSSTCLEHWPYVVAGDTETSINRSWRILSIDPLSGRLAEKGEAGSIRVWSYRDRPVYMHGGDKRPGDVNGGGTGEWRGQRNGLKAIWLRDDFMNGIL